MNSFIRSINEYLVFNSNTNHKRFVYTETKLEILVEQGYNLISTKTIVL